MLVRACTLLYTHRGKISAHGKQSHNLNCHIFFIAALSRGGGGGGGVGDPKLLSLLLSSPFVL